MITNIDILEFKKSLLPTGRAFKVAKNSNFEKFLLSLSDSELDFFKDAISLFDTMFPDNDNFTAEDAKLWEKRLGLYSGDNLTLRKKAIASKMNAPGTIKNRSTAKYMQYRLAESGFDVVIQEFTKITELSKTVTLGRGLRLGNFRLNQRLGFIFTGYIANRITQLEEETIPNDKLLVPTTFYISAGGFNPFIIPLESEKEFRRVVLSMKPLHTVAILNGSFPSAIVNDGLPYSLPFNL